MRPTPLTLALVMVVFACVVTAGVAFGQESPPAARSLPFAGVGSITAPAKDLLKSRLTPVLDDGDKGRQGRRLAGEKAPATLSAIVLMCDFSDSLMFGRFGQVPGEFPPPMQTSRYYTAHDSIYFQHLMGDVEDYFSTVSGGMLTVTTTVHPRTVNLPHPMWFYGDHPEEGEQQVLLAATVVDSLDEEIDFTAFDTFILVSAGAGEETDILGNSPEQIFSTYLDPDDFAAAMADSVLDTPYIPATGFPAGTGIDRVLVLPETAQQDPVGSFDGGFGALGIYCFEVGLHLGMLSLTDFTPSGRPDSQGIGNFGLMGYGLFAGLGFIPPHPCAYNKYLMGWLDPFAADAASGATWELRPSEQPSGPAACARVAISGQEYWLLEYRLQDPNGDRRFTFSDDLNGNGVPDFFDADSGNGDGTPTGKFDPNTDTRERVTDAEWDFAMSENNARLSGELAAGSGIYIWHIDEGVILDVFDAPGNLFNADPQRKSVDLEEADQIQDLDSSEPSDFMLGADDDSYRGEGTHEFGPRTLPPTDTAGGAATGIVFAAFSNVVVDSQAYEAEWNGFTYWGYDYADSMTFTLAVDTDPAHGPVPAAWRELPAGVDITGSDVLIARLESAGISDQIILAGQQGSIFVLDGQLNEYLDHDADPSTLEPFAVGLRETEPVPWNLPPAAGDLDHDGALEIVLTGPDGLYAFKADGTPVRDIEPGSFGLYEGGLSDCTLPPILLPAAFPGNGPTSPAAVCVVENTSGGARLRFFSGPEATPGSDINLGTGQVPSAPVLAGEFLLAAVADTLGGDHHLTVLDLTPSAIPEDPVKLELPLAGEPGPFPVTWGVTPESSTTDPIFFAIVVDVTGRGETVFFDGQLRRARDGVVWDEEIIVRSPLAPGGAFFGEGILGRVGHGGFWQDGWPRRPISAVEAVDGPGAGSPLVAELVDSPHNLDQYIFPSRDGRLIGLGTQGESQPGWPLGGPAHSAGSPALGPLAGESLLDLVAAGTFPRITGIGSESSALETEFVSAVAVWHDIALTSSVWSMAGGSPWRNGSYDATGWVTIPVVDQGTGLVSGSHHCYPSPLLSGPLQVRGQVRSSARARAFIYNLEGEEVTSTDWRQVTAVDPFSIEVALDGATTGLYLCRLVVESDNGATDYSVVQFAVVR